MVTLWLNTLFPISLPSKSTPANLLQLLLGNCRENKCTACLFIYQMCHQNGVSHILIFFSFRNRREDKDAVEFECDSWSDDSCGSDNLSSRSLSNSSSKAWDSFSLDSCCDQVSLSSWPTRDMLGYLYLQYNETSTPSWRVPFTEKVAFYC